MTADTDYVRDEAMNERLRRSASAIGVLVVLVLVWLIPIDQAANKAVDDGLKRALVTFSTARAANAILSVAESAQVSVLVGQVSPGKLVRPVNQVVEQLADLMLAASVVLGVMKLLMLVGGHIAVSIAVTALAGYWLTLKLRSRSTPYVLNLALMLAIFVRLAIPVTVVSSEVVFQKSLMPSYEVSQQALDIEQSIGSAPDNPSKWLDWVKGAKAEVERRIGQMVTMMALFLVHTLLIPGLMALMLLGFWRYLLARMQ